MSEKSIKWYSQKDLAKAIGVSVNTFKEQYREQFPPNRTVGQRVYWSSGYVENIKQKLDTPQTTTI